MKQIPCSIRRLAALATVVLAATVTKTNALAVGDEICIEGFVMDLFCIKRGTLFDNPSVVTLANPERHSVHCLVDVTQCLASPFEVLFELPEPEGNIRFSRGWRLDDQSKEEILTLARAVGRIAASPGCTTCTEDNGGSLDNGFHAGMVATVVSLSSGNDPAVISISRAEHSSQEALFCGANGAGNTGLEASNPDSVITDSGSNFEKKARAHGALMLIGWGWLLPSGVIIAKFFRHRPNALWYQIHRACQTIGLLCSIAGFIIAIRNFDVFGAKGEITFQHGVMGATTMALGLFQPINALLRPHPNEEGQETNIFRTIWEILHKGIGYGTLLLAVATIGVGTTLLPQETDQRAYQMAYGIGIGFCLLSLTAFGVYDASVWQEVPQDDAPKSGKGATEKMNVPEGP